MKLPRVFRSRELGLPPGMSYNSGFIDPNLTKERREQGNFKIPAPMEIEYVPPQMGFGREARYDPRGPRQEEL